MLLTRTPLYSWSCPHFLVRLACVRHAASVDSEPGSNSRLKPEPPRPGRRSGRDLLPRARKAQEPYFVRSLELKSSIPSHDWHVQPVIKDRIAFPPKGLLRYALDRTRQSSCPRNLMSRSLASTRRRLSLCDLNRPPRHSHFPWSDSTPIGRRRRDMPLFPDSVFQRTGKSVQT